MARRPRILPPASIAPAAALPAAVARWFAHPPPALGTRIRVAGVGVREWMQAGRVDRVHGTGDWLVMVFHQPVEVGLGPAWRPVAAGTLMLWPPGATQRYGTLQRSWLHSWLHCSGTALDALVADLALPCAQPLPGIDPGVIERTALDVHREVTSHLSADPVIIHNLVEILLHAVARALRPVAAAAPPALLAVRHHLETCFHEPASLDELARRAGMSAHHFCSAFHRHFGAAPIDFLIRVRLEQARWLLRDRNRSIAAVARAVGIPDPHYFAKLCRRRLGRSPSSLRAQT